jgi:CubicO group peptidase (beta-lactamase class C family)
MKVLYSVLLIGLLIASPAFAADDREKLAQVVSKLVMREIDEGRGVGITVAVARGDELIHHKGYGLIDIENEVPASEKSVYRIGSITKMFTAVAILLLREDGKLKLEDPLSKFIPDYPSGDKITLLHLLNHTSGIVSFTDLPEHREGMRKDLKHEEVLALFKDKEMQFQPGEKYRYCNSGYYLLGMVIEIASEKKYEEFLKERIFEPLEMKAIVYDRHGKIIPHRAQGYTLWGKRKYNAPFVSMNQPFAAGSLASTAEDMVLWQRGLVNNSLLKPESYQAMIAPGELNNGKKTKYGLGCVVDKIAEHAVVRHGGGIPGFITDHAYFPESDLTVVVLTNTNRVVPRSIVNKIALSVFANE